MSHHGHSGFGTEVYLVVATEVCLWCVPKWLHKYSLDVKMMEKHKEINGKNNQTLFCAFCARHLSMGKPESLMAYPLLTEGQTLPTNEMGGKWSHR